MSVVADATNGTVYAAASEELWDVGRAMRSGMSTKDVCRVAGERSNLCSLYAAWQVQMLLRNLNKGPPTYCTFYLLSAPRPSAPAMA